MAEQLWCVAGWDWEHLPVLEREAPSQSPRQAFAKLSLSSLDFYRRVAGRMGCPGQEVRAGARGLPRPQAGSRPPLIYLGTRYRFEKSKTQAQRFGKQVGSDGLLLRRQLGGDGGVLAALHKKNTHMERICSQRIGSPKCWCPALPSCRMRTGFGWTAPMSQPKMAELRF